MSLHCKLLRFILSLHKGHFNFCLSQKLMHVEWNLCEHCKALIIWPDFKSSRQMAQESGVVDSSSFLLEFFFFSSYLKLGIALMMFFTCSGDGRGWPSSSRGSSSPYSSPYSLSWGKCCCIPLKKNCWLELPWNIGCCYCCLGWPYGNMFPLKLICMPGFWVWRELSMFCTSLMIPWMLMNCPPFI